MEQVDAGQELAFIKKVMADSRRSIEDNGLDYIVWGIIVALGMFATCALSALRAEVWAGPWVYLALWIAVMAGGWVFSLIRYMRYCRRARATTLAGRMLGAIWLACGIAIMMLIFVLSPLGKADPSPAIAVVLGIGFFLSGLLLDFAPLRWASACWWAGAVGLALGKPQALEMLVFGVMMVLFQVVPGIVLNRALLKTAGGNVPQA